MKFIWPGGRVVTTDAFSPFLLSRVFGTQDRKKPTHIELSTADVHTIKRDLLSGDMSKSELMEMLVRLGRLLRYEESHRLSQLRKAGRPRKQGASEVAG